MVASSLDPVKKFKKRDGSLNETFNLNMIKSKYHGLENFLEESYSRRNGGIALQNSTDRSSVKRSWLN
jgi:hypothetical protein